MVENNDPVIDMTAEKIYNFCCANRKDNLTKDKMPGDPRKIGCEFSELMEEAKDFYRNIATWYIYHT